MIYGAWLGEYVLKKVITGLIIESIILAGCSKIDDSIRLTDEENVDYNPSRYDYLEYQDIVQEIKAEK